MGSALRHLYRALLALLGGIAVSGEPEPVRLVLHWLPQSQFAGYYMARDQGYYEQAGLEVTLLHAGPGMMSSADFLRTEKAEFATMFLSDAIVLRDEGLPLRNVAQIVNRSNLMLIAWKGREITEPKDLQDQPLSMWQGSFSVAFEAFFQQRGIAPQIVPQHYSIDLFLQRGVVACAAMEYNEYHRLYQAGIDYEQMTVFLMRDYGLGFVEDGLYCLDTFRELHPELTAAMRKATLQGWEHVQAHPEQALDTVLAEARQAGVPVNRPHARWMLDHILASVFPTEADRRFGELSPRDFSTALLALMAAGKVQQRLEAADFTHAGEE